MKALLITNKGEENAASIEIKRILNVDSKAFEKYIEFSIKDMNEMFKICYYSQTAKKIVLLDDLNNWLDENLTFCLRADNKELERELGGDINEEGKYKVDLENPDVPLYHIDGKTGIDFTGDISKREHRVFTNKHTLKGTTAAALLIEAGYNGQETLLDPFAQDGTIVIEAAHLSTNKSVRHFDWDKMNFVEFDRFEDIDFDEMIEKFEENEISSENKIHATSSEMREINAIKKNAKIANINKEIDFSRKDLDYLDQKFDEKEIDLIVSYMPRLSEKRLQEFFHQAEYIAKKVVLLVDEEFNPENPYFEVENKKILKIGQSQKRILWLKKIPEE
ncbi:RNA methyltransferase [Candidatus Woesearchaeota archaeon]|nr:RNA methyltransferase [Candidatus Woesearchaeota archaeon]